jgi:hypothetical protein
MRTIVKLSQETWRSTKEDQSTRRVFANVARCPYFALYWVLFESAELRQAPFFGMIWRYWTLRAPIDGGSMLTQAPNPGPGSCAGASHEIHADHVHGNVPVSPRGQCFTDGQQSVVFANSGSSRVRLKVPQPQQANSSDLDRDTIADWHSARARCRYCQGYLTSIDPY